MNTHKLLAHTAFCSLFVAAGIACLLLGTQGIQAQNTSQGALVETTEQEATAILLQGPTHLAAPAEMGAGMQVALGMLLILLGFLLHAMFSMHEERTVQVHGPRKKKSVAANQMDKTRELLEFFWVERR